MPDTEVEATETVVIIGYGYWGQGSTLVEAKKKFKSVGGMLADGYAILTFDKETKFAGIDGMGRYYYERRDGKDEPANAPTEQIVKPKGRK